MKKHATIFCLMGMLFCTTVLLAQMGPMGGKDHPPRVGMERIESFKKVRMMEVLKLDENLSIKFMAKYMKHQEMIRGLEKQASEILTKMEQQVKDGASDADYEQSFNALVDVSKQIGETRAKFIGDMREILTNKQIAEYLVFERNFARELRDVIRDLQKERTKDK